MSRLKHKNIFNIKIVAETIKKELERRRIQLWFYRFLYYKHDESAVSDFEYDTKEYEYKVLSKFYTWFPPQGTCPLESVGTDTDEKTEEKVNFLISIHQKNQDKKEKKPEEPQPPIPQPIEPLTQPSGQLALFAI